MQDNPQPIANEQEVLNYYKEHYKTKICSEITFEASMNEKNKKAYQKFQSSFCCVKPLSLLIYSIFVLIITCVGFYFRISNNEGYKAYKGLLERNMSLIDTSFPDEHETLQLVTYLTQLKDVEDTDCTYIKYKSELCELEKYREFCTTERYLESKCNYMDHQFYGGYYFVCDKNSYQAGQCSPVQYYYYLKDIGETTYQPKISPATYETNKIEIHLKSLSILKIWCNIGDYDQPIYLSFIILLAIFIILLIFDLILNKKTLTSGIEYYTIISLYMIYWVIFRIYTILFFILIYYGLIVCLSYPNTVDESDEDDSTIRDPFFDSDVIILFQEEKLWKDKRANALIFCGICLILFIMVMILGFYKKLIYNYLAFNFDERKEEIIAENIPAIKRKAAIKVGNISYDFEINQNKYIYMKENRTEKIHTFKEVIFQNEVYYLKSDNIGLRDQLCWNEFNYPNINEVFTGLVRLLTMFFVISFFLISISMWDMKDEPTMVYYNHLIDLGYKPKKHKYIEGSYDLNKFNNNFFIVIYIIMAIVVILSIAKWTFFGGFKYMIFIWISIFVSVIIALFNLAVAVLSVIGFVYNLLGFLGYSDDEYVEFEDDYLFVDFMLAFYFDFYIFIFSITAFSHSLKLISPLNSIKNGNQQLETENNTSEDIFKYFAHDNQNWILEAVNNNNLPKHLFYQKK